MVTINLLFIITILAGALSLYDGIARIRGRGSNSILAIAEIVFAALLLVSVFVAFPAPLGLLTWAILLEIALVLVLVLRGGASRRGVWVVTIIALVLNTIVVLVNLGWLHVPGLF